MWIIKLSVYVGKYRYDRGTEGLFVGSLSQSNCFPSSQFSEENVPEVEFSLLFLQKVQVVLLVSFLQPWPVKILQNVCSHLVPFSSPSYLLVSIPSCVLFSYCHVPSLLPDATVPPSSKHSWIQLGSPLVQNSISSDNLILDDPILERYLWMESQRSKIPF